jgi:hypothetical protein
MNRRKFEIRLPESHVLWLYYFQLHYTLWYDSMIFVKLNNKHAVYIEYIQTWLKLFDCLVGKSHIFSRSGTDIQKMVS